MKFRSRKRKLIAFGSAGVLAIAGAGVAWAYFTTTGSGTGTATVGTGSLVTIAQDAFGGGNPAVSLTPGGPAQALGFTITNPSSGHQYVSTVSAAVAVSNDASGVQCTGPDTPTGCNPLKGAVLATPGNQGSVVSGCLASWFTVTGSPVTIDQDIAGSNGTYDKLYSASGLTLKLDNASVIQDACKGATVGLIYTSN